VNEPAHQISVRVFVRHKTTCDHNGEEGHAKCRCANPCFALSVLMRPLFQISRFE